MNDTDEGGTAMDDDDKYVTVEERAQEERRTAAGIYSERHRGEGPPAYRVGRRLLYKRSELRAWRSTRAAA